MHELSTMNIETRNNGSPVPQTQESGLEAPSGFILKLSQMVNGAPDEVISWTPSGDAFVIRSDLKRLESETLPQYFRHNRFQSLVRQLNFYSFRKINRERNVWIYKHKLFHRDRPEDLHLVRRRTCPGLDGRKQRFSRFSAQKLTDVGSASEDDESSFEEVFANEVSVSSEVSLKREIDVSSLPISQPEPKRSRNSCTTPVTTELPESEVFVDTSMISDAPVRAEEGEEVASQNEKDERTESVEQALIVSEVSKKLEQYAKRAAYGGSASRSRRGGSGIVTPPYGSGQGFSSAALLTYDDEYLGQPDDETAFSVVTDSDSLSNNTLAWSATTITPEKNQAAVAENLATAQTIVARILETRPMDKRADLVAPTSVIGFCIATAPIVDQGLCGKILELLASCEQLAIDFKNYRGALRPDSAHGHGTLGQIWSRPSSRYEAVRDFKTFAVNVFAKFLASSDLSLETKDRLVLERTTEAWVKSL